MTVIHLGNTGFPRGQEIVTTPQYLLGSSERDPVHTSYPVFTTSTGIGESETTRAAYSQWKQQHGIAGLTIGNTAVSNTQIIATLIGGAAGLYLGGKYLNKNYSYLTAVAGALVAYFISKKGINNLI